jgi:lipid-A-disaccharide synthase-like uncharacterized protein
MSPTTAWIGLGFLGQIFFSARFLVQWLASERAGRSIVPPLFWALSIGGSLILLVYAIHRHDPVFILGQSAGLAIYGRNMQLLARERRNTESTGRVAAP